jgi:hypothetical protein
MTLKPSSSGATTFVSEWEKIKENNFFSLYSFLFSHLCYQKSLNICPAVSYLYYYTYSNYNVQVNFFSEGLILVSTNLQYDKRLFIELRVQYMKIPSSEHVENMLCTQIVFLFWHSIQLCSLHILCLLIFMYWTRYSMNNLWSYFGLIDTRISASDKYLPLLQHAHLGEWKFMQQNYIHCKYIRGNFYSS